MDTETSTLPVIIRAARLAAGMSTTELAFRIGVSEMAVRFWESGANRPHALRLPTLAKVLKIDKAALDVAYANDNGEAA